MALVRGELAEEMEDLTEKGAHEGHRTREEGTETTFLSIKEGTRRRE